MTINYQFPYYPYTQFPGQPGYNQLGGTPYSNQYQSSSDLLKIHILKIF